MVSRDVGVCFKQEGLFCILKKTLGKLSGVWPYIKFQFK